VHERHDAEALTLANLSRLVDGKPRSIGLGPTLIPLSGVQESVLCGISKQNPHLIVTDRVGFSFRIQKSAVLSFRSTLEDCLGNGFDLLALPLGEVTGGLSLLASAGRASIPASGHEFCESMVLELL
jgi:hypothetical protein